MSLRRLIVEVDVVANRVAGPVRLERNLTGQTPIVLAANTVSGALRCVGNEPPPVNNGQPNTVDGPTSGQCLDL